MRTQALDQTPSQTVGPFFSYGLFFGGEHILVNDQTKGEHISLTGQVLDGDGVPVTDALVEIWQPDASGIFNHPNDPNHERADPHFKGFGRSETVNNGMYRFETIKPGVIDSVAATSGLADGVAPYINVRVFARGMLIHVVTRIYFADEVATASDPLLASVDSARRKTLLAQRIDAGKRALYHFDIRLQGNDETVFFDA